MPSDREQLLREYKEYDAKVDVVSAFEVFFTESSSLPATVAHFERFPRYRAPDGELVTPDFIVLFEDGTLLVGEISKLARDEHSLEVVGAASGHAGVVKASCVEGAGGARF